MNTTPSLTVVVEKLTIQIGRDFVEAVTGTRRSHGIIELRRSSADEPVIYSWVSTQDIAPTERILRDSAAREKLRVTSFQSQSV